MAPALLDDLPPERDLVVDRGYDAKALLDLVAARGGRAHIPTSRDRKVQRSVDPALYRHRNLVERFFNKLKHFRRIATRYDKLARNFLSAVLIASTRLWTRFESTPQFWVSFPPSGSSARAALHWSLFTLLLQRYHNEKAPAQGRGSL